MTDHVTHTWVDDRSDGGVGRPLDEYLPEEFVEEVDECNKTIGV